MQNFIEFIVTLTIIIHCFLTFLKALNPELHNDKQFLEYKVFVNKVFNIWNFVVSEVLLFCLAVWLYWILCDIAFSNLSAFSIGTVTTAVTAFFWGYLFTNKIWQKALCLFCLLLTIGLFFKAAGPNFLGLYFLFLYLAGVIAIIYKILRFEQWNTRGPVWDYVTDEESYLPGYYDPVYLDLKKLWGVFVLILVFFSFYF